MVYAKDLCLSIDLGGTTLLIGAVDRRGNIVLARTYETGYRDQLQAAEAIFYGVEDFLVSAGEMGIRECFITAGGGLVGQVDPFNGEWHSMYNDIDRHSIPLAIRLEDGFGLPCFLDNDVKAATFAEIVFGVGRKCHDFTYVNIGTGIAAGFVCDGRLLRGGCNNAGEIGHMIVDSGSKVKCSCGNYGCVEALASGRALEGRYRALLDRQGGIPASHIGGTESFSASDLFDLVQTSDPLAGKIAADAVRAISAMINNIVTCLSPQQIVFGGGVMVGGWMLKRIRENLPSRAANVTISMSTLDPRTIGLIGASVIGFQGIAGHQKNQANCKGTKLR